MRRLWELSEEYNLREGSLQPLSPLNLIDYE